MDYVHGMVSPWELAQRAYGQAVLTLGLVARAELERVAAGLGPNRSLRDELLARGLIDSAGDARALARMRRAATEDRDATADTQAADGESEESTLIGAGPPAPTLPARLPGPGATVAGVTIERELGRGGMGAVFAARAPDGARCAVKVQLGRSDSRTQRFSREAEAGLLLDHPGIAKVHGYGEQEGSAGSEWSSWRAPSRSTSTSSGRTPRSAGGSS